MSTTRTSTLAWTITVVSVVSCLAAIPLSVVLDDNQAGLAFAAPDLVLARPGRSRRR